MANGLAGKSVIVTGAARGVGRAIAHACVSSGASVMMADIDEGRLDAEVAALAGEGYAGKAAGFHADLRDKLAMTNLMAATLDAHDGVDVLVNASRHLATSDPLNPEADAFDALMAQNVTATLRLSQIVAKRMIELAEIDRSDRAILNVSSVYARRTLPKLMAFSISSAALDQLTRSLAVVLAPHRIRVNAIAVGGMLNGAFGETSRDMDDNLSAAMTSVVPLGRLGDAEEVAEAALFLVSPAASFVTGQILAVDGGRLLLDPLQARSS